jgi:hypothetical protein
MANHIVQLPPILQQSSDRLKIGLCAALLLLAPIVAFAVATGARVFEGFAPFAKSANVRVAQDFEDVKRTVPVPDELKNALASLSQGVQSEPKPPVKANGE